MYIFRENETPQQREARLSKKRSKANEHYSSLSTRERRDRNAKSNALRDIRIQAMDENQIQDLKKKESSMKKISRNQR